MSEADDLPATAALLRTTSLSDVMEDVLKRCQVKAGRRPEAIRLMRELVRSLRMHDPAARGQAKLAKEWEHAMNPVVTGKHPNRGGGA